MDVASFSARHFDAQIPRRTTTSNRNKEEQKLQLVGVCAIVRGLLGTSCKVVVDLSGSTEGLRTLYLYRVSTDASKKKR